MGNVRSLFCNGQTSRICHHPTPEILRATNWQGFGGCAGHGSARSGPAYVGAQAATDGGDFQGPSIFRHRNRV